MFILRAYETSRLSLSKWTSSIFAVAFLAILLSPKAFATTYHATGGGCQDNNPDNGLTQWNFVLNPSSSNPSTLEAINSYSPDVQFGAGQCVWNGFAPAGTISTGGTLYLTVEGEIDCGDGCAAPAPNVSISTPLGGFTLHAPVGSSSYSYGPTTYSYTIPAGKDLSTISVTGTVKNGSTFVVNNTLTVTSLYITD